MKGQWIGDYEGTNSGLAVLDLDDEGDHYRGTLFAFESNPNLPSVFGEIVTPNNNGVQELEIEELAALRPNSTVFARPADLEKEIEGLTLPHKISLKLETTAEGILAKWETDIGTNGTALLFESHANEASEIEPISQVKTWKEFKDYALDLASRQFIFRGQPSPKRLRTSFHRSRRKDLIKYLLTDIPEVHRSLTARTRHLFNLADPPQLGAFLNLMQHHGYPTPLLDWTYSPFVAAFFAFRFRRGRAVEEEKIRILVFDSGRWQTDFNQVQNLAFARPHFSILESLAIENPRALPQQSVSTVTNVDDIESYIRSKEVEVQKSYLTAIDLPFEERRVVMKNLSAMGIAAGALFPGLDGACEELRGRFFHPV